MKTARLKNRAKGMCITLIHEGNINSLYVLFFLFLDLGLGIGNSI